MAFSLLFVYSCNPNYVKKQDEMIKTAKEYLELAKKLYPEAQGALLVVCDAGALKEDTCTKVKEIMPKLEQAMKAMESALSTYDLAKTAYDAAGGGASGDKDEVQIAFQVVMAAIPGIVQITLDVMALLATVNK